LIQGDRTRRGGVWGHEAFLEEIRDPKREEHDSMFELVAGAFDLKALELDASNSREPKDIEQFASWS
jgi:hypothetical protein